MDSRHERALVVRSDASCAQDRVDACVRFLMQRLCSPEQRNEIGFLSVLDRFVVPIARVYQRRMQFDL